MRIFRSIIALAILAPGVYAGELLDRIVVTVNGNALLQSDWDGEMRYESFMAARPLEEATPRDRESALNRIIDQELLREQMRPSDLKPASAAAVEAQLNLLKAQYEREHQGNPGMHRSTDTASAKVKFAPMYRPNSINCERSIFA